MGELESKNNVFFHRIIIITFVFLVIVSSGLVIYANYIKSHGQKTEGQSLSQQQKATQDLYLGSLVERNQRGLSRGRFVKIENGSLYLEYYSTKTSNSVNGQEFFRLPDSVYVNCEERYFVASDGTKIDKLTAMTDTSNYYGEKTTGGLGINWFIKNAKKGQAVEVRFLAEGSDRIPTQVLLYKDKCN